MLTVRAERTDVTRRLVNQTVTDHFIFPFEALAAFGAIAAVYGTVVWAFLRVDVFVRAMTVLSERIDKIKEIY